MMSSRAKSLRSTILTAAMLAALTAGIGTATAQPGSEFQNQGIREDNGLPRFGELQVRRPLRPARIKSCSYRRNQGRAAPRRARRCAH
jgi:hypothetical protein